MREPHGDDIGIDGDVVDAVVIGAGMAGLTAARTLAEAGLDVLVLEARDRIGGRMWTNRDLADDPIELGAEFIHTADAPTLDEAHAAGFQLLACNPADGFRMSIGGVDSPELFGDPSLAALGDLLGDVERYEGPDISAREFVDRRGLTGVARVMADQMLSVHPLGDLHELGMHGLRDDRVVELERGIDHRLAAGYDQLVRAIADDLPVRLGAVVTAVEWSAGGVRVEASNGETVGARAAVCTLPVGVLRKGAVRFSPDLPPAKWRALSFLEMGAVTKVLLRFREQFWPDDLTMLGCDGPVRLYWTPLYGRAGAEPVLTAYVGGYRARALSAMSDAAAIACVAADLDRLFPDVGPSRLVVDGRRVDWVVDPFAGGGYSFVRVGGRGARDALGAADTGALFWAGDATATATIASVVHGAYDTGVRAAGEVLTHLGGS